MNIAKRLKELMNQRGLTIYSLAKAADVSWTTVKNLFNRTENPTVATMELICKGLGVTMSDFFSEESPSLPDQKLNFIVNSWESLSERDRNIVTEIVRSMKKNG